MSDFQRTKGRVLLPPIDSLAQCAGLGEGFREFWIKGFGDLWRKDWGQDSGEQRGAAGGLRLQGTRYRRRGGVAFGPTTDRGDWVELDSIRSRNRVASPLQFPIATRPLKFRVLDFNFVISDIP